MYGEWGTKLITKKYQKHILQWKLVLIMFASLFAGIVSIILIEALYSYYYGLDAENTQILFETGWQAIVMDIFFLVVTVIVFLLLSRNFVKRIEILNSSIKKISKGNMNNIPLDNKNDEIGGLSRSICEISEMLTKSMEDERRMVCNIAHDLRTPVTSIQGYAQLLEQNEDLSIHSREQVEIIRRKSEQLSAQIAELLDYSILQFEEKEYTFEELSLSRLVEQIFIDFIPEYEKNQITYVLYGNEDEHKMQCNAALMIRMLENLLNNALRYGKEGKKVEAVLSENEESICLEIANYGSAMKKAEAERIFEPFYQGGNAKEYETESKGLGLAIVAKIVAIHSGTIHVECDEEIKRMSIIINFKKANK